MSRALTAPPRSTSVRRAHEGSCPSSVTARSRVGSCAGSRGGRARARADPGRHRRVRAGARLGGSQRSVRVTASSS